MNFEDGRFQECLFRDFSGDCGAGGQCCRSCAIGEVRIAPGHPMIRIWMLLQKFLDSRCHLCHGDLPFICVFDGGVPKFQQTPGLDTRH